MKLTKIVDLILLTVFLFFSLWLMNKSFGYDSTSGKFRIARHQVGDFGLHLALIRSFSWGNNFPPESPFYPAVPLPYHYGVDLAVGFLEKAGIRIDYGLNGISAIFFALLLYIIYKLSQILFGPDRLTGLLSVCFFLFSSNLSFLDFFKNKTFGMNLFSEIWRLPDYIHKGPSDGSLISIFFSLNPYLNQRHLIVGMALSLIFLTYVIRKLLTGGELTSPVIVTMAVLLGLSTRIHVLLAFGTGLAITCLFIIFRKLKYLASFLAFSLLFALPHINEILNQGSKARVLFNPGFLAARPLSLSGILQFWWLNLGLALIFIPVGFACSKSKQQKVLLAFLPLFIIANIFQLSYRMEHNYSIISLFLIIASMFIARMLRLLWKGNFLRKTIAIFSFVGLTASGLLNLMVVKNDFQYPVADIPANSFARWIKDRTAPRSIFLSRQDLYDPVVLAGRRSYFGATYYLEVMGYDVAERKTKTKEFFEANSVESIAHMKLAGIQFVVIPNRHVDDFPYMINRVFLNKNLDIVYSDEDVTVYKL